MGWFRKINKNGEDYKPIGNVITATSLSVSGPDLADGDVVRVMFTTDIAGSDTTTPLALTWNSGATPVPVKAMKNGSLVGMYAIEYAANLYRYISAYATLELVYDETNAQFVVMGNPVVLSGPDYTIYADGKVGDVPIGTIVSTAASTAPYGWLMCDNTTRSKVDYEELWSVLPASVKNTTNNTFVLDMRNRAIMGADSSVTANQIGKTQDGDVKKHTHVMNHGHGLNRTVFGMVANTVTYLGGAGAGYTTDTTVLSVIGYTGSTQENSSQTQNIPVNIRWNYIIKAKP